MTTDTPFPTFRPTITPEWSVEETLLRHPETIIAFKAFRVDPRHGDASIAEAAQVADVPLQDLLHAITSVVRREGQR